MRINNSQTYLYVANSIVVDLVISKSGKRPRFQIKTRPVSCRPQPSFSHPNAAAEPGRLLPALLEMRKESQVRFHIFLVENTGKICKLGISLSSPLKFLANIGEMR